MRVIAQSRADARRVCGVLSLCLALTPGVALRATAGVEVTCTNDLAVLQSALNARGLTVTSIVILNGWPGQIGTYTNFSIPPVTIEDGVVLSTGDVLHLGPPADPTEAFPEPSYCMDALGTAEFDGYGPGHIENFSGSYDVAALQVNFNLATNGQARFDFVFGSVEYSFWTGNYTDALLVFLDGTDPTNQIAFDHAGQPVQVGKSFAGAVETRDQNTAFASPHGLLECLTTTTAVLAPGDHTLTFEVGDVRDGILDSAAFIANLRMEPGRVGTEPTHPLPLLVLRNSECVEVANVSTLSWTNCGVPCALESAAALVGDWQPVTEPWTTNDHWINVTVTNTASTQFYRLRKD